MKQQNLLTKMLLLFALVVGSVSSVWATLPNNPLWKATALSDISNGARIIIISNSTTATNIALPSTTTSSSPSKIACNVSTTDGVTTITAPTGKTLQDLAWTVSKVTSGENTTYKFYQEGSTTVRLYLSGTGSNTALKVGDAKSSYDEFVMGNLGKLLKVSTATRFVGPYDNNGNDWRTYNTEDATNYKGAKLTFYVLQESSDPSSAATFSNSTPSINFPGTKTYSQTATTATGYNGTVTYEITANTAGATISGSTVTVTQEGSVTVKATAPAVTGFAASTASYTLTVNDTRSDNGLAFAESSQTIKIGSILNAPTLTNPNGLTVSYSSGNNEIATVDEGGNVTGVAAGTTTITASFAGNGNFKAGSASYTIEVYDPNAKGTIYNPYTADEVIAGETGTGTDVYVIGYIVGGFNSSNKFTTTASDYQNSNFAIATSPTESDDTKVVPIQVQGTFQTSFGLKDKSYNAGVAKVLIKGDLERYFSRPGVKNVKEISKIAEVVNISAAGMATYYTDCALDFTDFNDMYAYVATTEGTTINYKRVKKVPAKTAVLLRNPNETSASHDVPVITEGAETVSDNQFVGTLTQIESLATEGGSNSKNYILNNGSNGVGFYWANGQTVGVHRAYLNVPAGVSAPFLGFNEDEGTTSINSIERTINDNQYYDLSGHRVAQPTKGVFIVNGKKVVIK